MSPKQQLRLLELIAEHGPLTGGQCSKLDKTLDKGTVHTTLHRMAADGLVKADREERDFVSGYPRALFSLTSDGLAELVAACIAEACRQGRVILIEDIKQ